MSAVPQIIGLQLCDSCGGRGGEGFFRGSEVKADGVYFTPAALEGEPGHRGVGMLRQGPGEPDGRVAHVGFSAWYSGRVVEVTYRAIFDAAVTAEVRTEALSGFVEFAWATFRMHAMSQFAMMLAGLPADHALVCRPMPVPEDVARSVAWGLEPSPGGK